MSNFIIVLLVVLLLLSCGNAQVNTDYEEVGCVVNPSIDAVCHVSKKSEGRVHFYCIARDGQEYDMTSTGGA